MSKKTAAVAAVDTGGPSMSAMRSMAAESNRLVSEAKKAFIADPLDNEVAKRYRSAVADHIRDAKAYAKARAKGSK